MENINNINLNEIDSKVTFNQSIIDSVTLESVHKTLNKINAFHAIVKGSLIPEIDYGLIPGAKKPSLYKSGAETIMMLFGLIATVEILAVTPQQFHRDTDFISYSIKCKLVKNDCVVAEGIGTCNSSEKKYCKEEALNIANTIMKMASKRALIDAILHVASLSAVFAHETGEITEYLHKETMENLNVKDASTLKITFGKHKGRTCGEVYKEDFDYVQWFFEKGRDEKVRKAFEILSQAVKMQAERAAKRSENLPGFEDDDNGTIDNKNDSGGSIPDYNDNNDN